MDEQECSVLFLKILTFLNKWRALNKNSSSNDCLIVFSIKIPFKSISRYLYIKELYLFSFNKIIAEIRQFYAKLDQSSPKELFLSNSQGYACTGVSIIDRRKEKRKKGKEREVKKEKMLRQKLKKVSIKFVKTRLEWSAIAVRRTRQLLIGFSPFSLFKIVPVKTNPKLAHFPILLTKYA